MELSFVGDFHYSHWFGTFLMESLSVSYYWLVDSQSLYDVSVLIDDLRSDQSAVRAASMKRLKEIGIHRIDFECVASVLGEQRTRDELLPYLYGIYIIVF